MAQKQEPAIVLPRPSNQMHIARMQDVHYRMPKRMPGCQAKIAQLLVASSNELSKWSSFEGPFTTGNHTPSDLFKRHSSSAGSSPTTTLPESTMPIRRPPPNHELPDRIALQHLPNIQLPLDYIIRALPRRRHLHIHNHQCLVRQTLHAVHPV